MIEGNPLNESDSIAGPTDFLDSLTKEQMDSLNKHQMGIISKHQTEAISKQELESFTLQHIKPLKDLTMDISDNLGRIADTIQQTGLTPHQCQEKSKFKAFTDFLCKELVEMPPFEADSFIEEIMINLIDTKRKLRSRNESN